ncbi:MAG: zinc ribbon domain-containing protein [Deltaproteobacteria bacterium]
MNTQKTTFSKELQIIPWWAYLLALTIFLGFETIIGIAWRREPNPPPLALQYFIRFVPGTLLACFGLLIGYVNQDAKRRGMNRTLWTLLVTFIPNAIGFILYFLLRQPLPIPCPQCGALANPNFNFCPKCKSNLRPTCPSCQHAVNPGDNYCPNCSRELAPSRVPVGP